jgi:hypothetical protein
MPGILITITDAGRAALVAPGNTGTNAHKVVEIGLATAAFKADKALKKLPNELKRIKTFGGENIAPDTIHVTLKDDTADQYTLYGFGLYLEGGELAAVYCQPTPIMEKSPAALLLLSADIQFATIDAATLAFGDASFLNPPATTERQGVVELATNDESIAGTDAKRAVTPAGLQAALGPALAVKSNRGHHHVIIDVDGLQAALEGKSPVGHKHVIADVTDLQSVLDGKSSSGHKHVIADVAGLQSALDGKSPIGHRHVIADVADLQSALDGRSPIEHKHVIADVAGLQSALDGRSPIGHRHVIADVADLQSALDGRSPIGHRHAIADVADLQSALDGRSPIGHVHVIADVAGLQSALDARQPAGNYIVNSAWQDTTRTYFRSGSPPNISSISASGNADNVPLTITNAANQGASAVIQFHREGSFAAYFGLDVDNQWAVGGRSMGDTRFRIWHEGNLNPAPRRNYNAGAGYVMSDTGNGITINWDGNLHTHVDNQYQGALMHHNNFNNWAAPRSIQDIDGLWNYCVYKNPGGRPAYGTLIGIPGRPGTWRSMNHVNYIDEGLYQRVG